MPAERSEILKHGQFIADAWDARSIGSFSEAGPIAYGDIRPLAAAFNGLVRYLEQVEAELLAAQEQTRLLGRTTQNLHAELQAAQEREQALRRELGRFVYWLNLLPTDLVPEASSVRSELLATLAGSPSEKPDSSDVYLMGDGSVVGPLDSDAD